MCFIGFRIYIVVMSVFRFYLTTVEAALEHIRSGRLKEEAIKAYKVQVWAGIVIHVDIVTYLSTTVL